MAKNSLSEGTKYDDEKERYDLISTEFLDGLAAVLTFGVTKYEEWNWAKGIKYSRIFSAMMRHLWAWLRGETNDEETGLNHLFHAACCLMFLCHYETYKEQYSKYDDRFKGK